MKKFVVCILTNLDDPLVLSSVIQAASAEEAIGTVTMGILSKYADQQIAIKQIKYMEV